MTRPRTDKTGRKMDEALKRLGAAVRVPAHRRTHTTDDSFRAARRCGGRSIRCLGLIDEDTFNETRLHKP